MMQVFRLRSVWVIKHDVTVILTFLQQGFHNCQIINKTMVKLNLDSQL